MRSKKIRILTFHSAYSYGAVLQTYALYKFLCEYYTDVKVIDFRPQYFTLKCLWNRPKTWILCFQFRFRKKNIDYTKVISAEELRQTPPDADVYVIGSDQVWNPSITKSVQDIYFGNFIPRDRKKISYAASFGRTVFSKDEVDKIKSLIHDFSAISVREESAVLFCQQTLNLKTECVLDPTFLLNDYSHLFHANRTKKELGLFILNNSSNEVFDVAAKIASSMYLKPKIINKAKPIKGFKTIVFPSIPRFLKEIHNSTFIITNSFHGLAFSIIFNKQFAFVSTNPENVTRAVNILEQLNLSDRLFHSYHDLLESKIWNVSIDYEIVNDRLVELKQQSIHFLLSNI